MVLVLGVLAAAAVLNRVINDVPKGLVAMKRVKEAKNVLEDEGLKRENIIRNTFAFTQEEADALLDIPKAEAIFREANDREQRFGKQLDLIDRMREGGRIPEG